MMLVALVEEMLELDFEDLAPPKFVLKQNYPNPFNPVTQIQYDIDKSADVSLDLFDIRGAKVKTLVIE